MQDPQLSFLGQEICEYPSCTTIGEMFTEFRLNPYIEMAEMIRRISYTRGNCRTGITTTSTYVKLAFQLTVVSERAGTPSPAGGRAGPSEGFIEGHKLPMTPAGKGYFIYYVQCEKVDRINVCVCVFVLFWDNLIKVLQISILFEQI